eukprot:5522947-Pyramimonas_sp.AAC.1
MRHVPGPIAARETEKSRRPLGATLAHSALWPGGGATMRVFLFSRELTATPPEASERGSEKGREGGLDRSVRTEQTIRNSNHPLP